MPAEYVTCNLRGKNRAVYTYQMPTTAAKSALWVYPLVSHALDGCTAEMRSADGHLVKSLVLEEWLRSTWETVSRQ